MPIIRESWDVPNGNSGGGGKRHNYFTSTPASSAEACERIAEALGGTLLVRRADLDLEALHRTGEFPPEAAYAVDVTGFYESVANEPDGRPKLGGSSFGSPGGEDARATLFEIAYDDDAKAKIAREHAAQVAAQQAEDDKPKVKELWTFAASVAAEAVVTTARETWVKARRLKS